MASLRPFSAKALTYPEFLNQKEAARFVEKTTLGQLFSIIYPQAPASAHLQARERIPVPYQYSTA